MENEYKVIINETITSEHMRVKEIEGTKAKKLNRKEEYYFETPVEAWEFFYKTAYCGYRGVRDFFDGWGEDDNCLEAYCSDEAGATAVAIIKWEGFKEHYHQHVKDESTGKEWDSIEAYLKENPTDKKDLWYDDDNAYRLTGSVYVDRSYDGSDICVNTIWEEMSKEFERRQNKTTTD